MAHYPLRQRVEDSLCLTLAYKLLKTILGWGRGGTGTGGRGDAGRGDAETRGSLDRWGGAPGWYS